MTRIKISCPGPEVIKLFFRCSTQLSMKLQLLIRTKMPRNIDLLDFKFSDVAFIKLINVKMPTNVDILTFMSKINLVLCTHDLRWLFFCRGL